MYKSKTAPDAKRRIDYKAYMAFATGAGKFNALGTTFYLDNAEDVKYIKEVAITSWKQKQHGIYYGALSDRQIDQLLSLQPIKK